MGLCEGSRRRIILKFELPGHTGQWLREGSGLVQPFVATRFSMWIVTLAVTLPRYIMVGILIATECGTEVGNEKFAIVSRILVLS